MKRYFYFRTVTSAAADDNIDDSILVPVENITGFYGQSDTRIDVYFSPVTLTSAVIAASDFKLGDFFEVTYDGTIFHITGMFDTASSMAVS